MVTSLSTIRRTNKLAAFAHVRVDRSRAFENFIRCKYFDFRTQKDRA